MKRSLLPVTAAVALLLLLAVLGLAQRRRGRFFRPPVEDNLPQFAHDAEFHFIRMEYTDLPEYRRGFGFVSRDGRGSGWWAQDWPDADDHFTYGIQRLTRVNVGEPRHLSLTDDKLFDYPWIYATQTGYWDLSNAETDRLREYLLRGGFLVVDDFWGPEEWATFRATMNRVLPNQSIPDLAESDPVMHVVYDIRDKDRTFIPGSRHLWRGPGDTVEVVQPEGTSPAWRAMYDDEKHMVVAVNYDTDVGDAWEFADVPYYPEKMTTLAYRYGINYLVYAMTH
jgi:hypothetical protein